ncbi:MAG TPA: response regulator transcription factor [Pyrinomonadaceae bacterium]|jgi:two-component system response regulator DesR|nr:response regulator transcription factor [Pyrinomonadaceae bacterium]
MNKPRILIAEDEVLILEGTLRPVLKAHFDIVAAVGNGPDAIAAAEEHRPDVALLDVSLPGLRGFDVARKILASQPACKVLFVSCYAEKAYVEAARELGASGYVLKGRVFSELVNAIRTAQSGEFYESAV